MAKKEIIDCDNMLIIGHFNEEDLETVINKLKNDPEWDDESFCTDRDGNLCLFRPTEEE